MPTTCTNTVSPNGKYILQKIVGEINAEIALELNRETHTLGHRPGVNRYLTDVTECRNTDTPLDNYNFAYSDMPDNPSIDRSARVALLVAPEDHSYDFVETACRNAGLNVTLFRDRDEAARYLLKE
ncbi:MAG: hypothetical protein R6W69_03995 [Anaerolineales bacterium]